MALVTVELPDALRDRLVVAAREQHVSEAELIRISLEERLRAPQPSGPSGYELVRPWVGCVASGVGDLASNPEHLAGLGR
jgi:hypothetical protein